MAQPDVFVVGMMKAGSTSLYRWLASHPEVAEGTKEPGTLLEGAHVDGDVLNAAGEAAYAACLGEGGTSIDASVIYSDPHNAPLCAARIAALPRPTRVLLILRQPVDRMRSHYVHEVLRGREKRPFLEAISEEGNAYVRRSSYARAVLPFARALPEERFRVLRFEDVVSGEAWPDLLVFLGLTPIDFPEGHHNASSGKKPYGRLGLFLFETGLWSRLTRLPVPPGARRLAKRVLLRSRDAVKDLEQSAREPVPGPILKILDDELSTLAADLPEVRAWADDWRGTTGLR